MSTDPSTEAAAAPQPAPARPRRTKKTKPVLPPEEVERRSRAGARSRRKGQAAERELVHKFRAVMPGADVRRGLQSRGGGAEVPDVDCPVFHIESKHGKQPNVRAALAQAVRDARKDKIAVAVIRDDRKEPFVALQLEDFLEFVREWWERRDR